MKSEVIGFGTPVNKKGLEELLKETKETLAVDVKIENNHRSFGVVDLWNAQKRQRSSASMLRRGLN